MDKPTILLIEDDSQDQTIVKAALENEGYVVEIAETGEAGLEVLQEQEPDLVLLDLILPGIDGLEVCRQIRGIRAVQYSLSAARRTSNTLVSLASR